MAAVAMLEPLGGDSIELAQAYANLAAQRMLDSRHEAAVEIWPGRPSPSPGFWALRVISDALNTEGVAAATLDREWVGPPDSALRIALTENLPTEAGRAYCNFYTLDRDQRRFAEAQPLYADGIAYCDDHDMTTFGTFLRSNRTSELEKAGRWGRGTSH